MDMTIWLKVKERAYFYVVCVCSCSTLLSLLTWNILVASGLTTESEYSIACVP